MKPKKLDRLRLRRAMRSTSDIKREFGDKAAPHDEVKPKSISELIRHLGDSAIKAGQEIIDFKKADENDGQ